MVENGQVIDNRTLAEVLGNQNALSGIHSIHGTKQDNSDNKGTTIRNYNSDAEDTATKENGETIE